VGGTLYSLQPPQSTQAYLPWNVRELLAK
jgi:hypothetical protein